MCSIENKSLKKSCTFVVPNSFVDSCAHVRICWLPFCSIVHSGNPVHGFFILCVLNHFETSGTSQKTSSVVNCLSAKWHRKLMWAILVADTTAPNQFWLVTWWCVSLDTIKHFSWKLHCCEEWWHFAMMDWMSSQVIVNDLNVVIMTCEIEPSLLPKLIIPISHLHKMPCHLWQNKGSCLNFTVSVWCQCENAFVSWNRVSWRETVFVIKTGDLNFTPHAWNSMFNKTKGHVWMQCIDVAAMWNTHLCSEFQCLALCKFKSSLKRNSGKSLIEFQ